MAINYILGVIVAVRNRAPRPGQHRPTGAGAKARRAATAVRTPATWGEDKVRNFSSLDEAAKFTRALPPEVQSYILGYGLVMDPSRYQQHDRSWAALSQWGNRSHYRDADMSAIRAQRHRIFDEHPVRYRVVWL